MPTHQVAGLEPDPVKNLLGQQTRSCAYGDASGDAPLEPSNPNHEELIKVAGKNREEPHALEQGQVVILGEFENALVEPQPREFAVQEAVRVITQVICVGKD